MYKQQFIIDTDSLIKLTKSSIIKEVCKYFTCFITEEVYNEAVVKGKEGLYQDAFEIEKLIKNNLIKVKKLDEKKITLSNNLGEGEKSTFMLYKKLKNLTIVSDDNTFINFLIEEDAEFIIPTDFITLLKKLNKINMKKAIIYLDNMKPYIKSKVYSRVKNNIGGIK